MKMTKEKSIMDLPGVGAATAEKLENAGYKDLMSLAASCHPFSSMFTWIVLCGVEECVSDGGDEDERGGSCRGGGRRMGRRRTKGEVEERKGE